MWLDKIKSGNDESIVPAQQKETTTRGRRKEGHLPPNEKTAHFFNPQDLGTDDNKSPLVPSVVVVSVHEPQDHLLDASLLHSSLRKPSIPFPEAPTVLSLKDENDRLVHSEQRLFHQLLLLGRCSISIFRAFVSRNCCKSKSVLVALEWPFIDTVIQKHSTSSPDP